MQSQVVGINRVDEVEKWKEERQCERESPKRAELGLFPFPNRAYSKTDRCDSRPTDDVRALHSISCE